MRVATIRQSVARGIRSGALFLGMGVLAAGLQAAQAEAAFVFPLGHGVSTGSRAEQSPLQVSVKVENRQAPLYRADWRPDRWYVEARQGARYTVQVRNTSPERVAFVISVDGLNAINGVRSQLSSTEPMYVLDPYQSTTIKGWRRSLDKVAQFVFVDEERSYASRTDQANGDLGWIRVAAFRERHDQWEDEGQIRDNDGRSDASRRAAPRPESVRGTTEPYANGSPAPQSNPGTGWGQTKNDKVHEVDFDPERFACAQVILRYEYRDGLVSLGILPAPGDRTWQRDNGQFGFALPPPR
ncbi:MAG TPA: hypothetical protein VKF80_06365 [Candidatus Eisenbacteria bacterium]|nr:hypothetical protein [Candidatus Eisenbacteria bacterium]